MDVSSLEGASATQGEETLRLNPFDRRQFYPADFTVGKSDLAWPNALRPLAYLRLGQIHDLADDRRSAKAAYKAVQKLSREQPGLKSLAQSFLDRPYDGTFRVNFP